MMQDRSVSYEVLDRQPALDEAMRALAAAATVAVDLECDNNLHHYGMRVCLIQLAAAGRSLIVDAQAGLDFAGLKAVLEDPRIEKVMHDTDFDLRCLDGLYGIRPRGLFDTRIAARLLGHQAIGLAALLEHYFGMKLSKRWQRADWTRRPLPPEMLAYAAADAHHLLELRDRLAADLEARGRTAWAREEFALCEAIRFEKDESPLYQRVKGAGRLRGRELAILAELAVERDAIARELDLPVYKVISNEVLVAMADRPPHEATAEAIGRIRGLHPACRGRYAARLVAALERGARVPTFKWPRPKPIARRHSQPAVLDALKDWRLAAAAVAGLDADLVIPLGALRRLARGDALPQVLAEPPVRAWQRERFGEALERTIQDLRSRKQGSR